MQESRSVNELVKEAVEQFVRERQRAKLRQEIAAYEAMHPTLKQEYLGQWVAVHDQELVDHDRDDVRLRQRVRARYGNSTVLIRQVGEQPVEEVWIRTPSTGKIAT